ncbi:MAG: 2-nitropropane dioxygenase, partial [Nocardioides sp.]
SAALGGLEEHRADSSYELWRFYREGGGRLDEWRARYRAASTRSARLRVLLSAARVNRDHLRSELGHAPTRADVRRAQRQRVARLGREAARAVTASLRERP